MATAAIPIKETSIHTAPAEPAVEQTQATGDAEANPGPVPAEGKEAEEIPMNGIASDQHEAAAPSSAKPAQQEVTAATAAKPVKEATAAN